MMGFSVALMGTIAHQCQPMTTYQAPYVATTYNLTKHMGKYYELAFRDLYPGPPTCDCQHTTKVASSESDYYEEFDFTCFGPAHRPLPVTNLITLNGSTPGVYSQTIVASMGHRIPPALQSTFHTALVAFEEGASGYKWVLEFTCGATGVFKGFVGINMYSRENSSANLHAMIRAAKDLGLDWVIGDPTKFVRVPHGSSCAYAPAPDAGHQATRETKREGDSERLAPPKSEDEAERVEQNREDTAVRMGAALVLAQRLSTPKLGNSLNLQQPPPTNLTCLLHECWRPIARCYTDVLCVQMTICINYCVAKNNTQASLLAQRRAPKSKRPIEAAMQPQPSLPELQSQTTARQPPLP